MTPTRLVLALIACASAATAQSTQSPAPVSTPGPQVDHAVGFYDPGIQRVLLIGGAGTPKGGDRDKVWSWNGARWEIVTDSGPRGRVNAAGAFDTRRGKAIVAGGSRKTANDSSWVVVGDTWEGDRTGWAQTSEIGPRDHQSMVSDGRGAVLMFGGIPGTRTGPWPTDTWELDDKGWKRVAVDGPSGRGRTALAYDAKRRQVVLFGGVTASSGPSQPQVFLQDTWVWENSQWKKAAEGGPRGRYAHAMVFDESAGVVLMYGGAAAHSNAPLSDMWQWDGTSWTEIPLAGATPGHRYQPVMVYDRASKRTVLFGGISSAKDDTWEWDGKSWREIAP